MENLSDDVKMSFEPSIPPPPPPLPFLCHFLITSLSLILKVLLSASFSCQSELYTAARAKSTPSPYINSATYSIPWVQPRCQFVFPWKHEGHEIPDSICKTLDQEESVQPKECSSDLHLINSIDKQFTTNKASQHHKWGVERQQQQSHPLLLTLSNSAPPLSQPL